MNGHVKTVSGRNDLSQLLSPSKPISYHDDPAFSSDPHVHPFFVTHTPWSLNPDDDPRLLQLPPLTMVSDDHSSTTHETNSSSNHTSTTLSTPPTSADSHSSPWAPSTSEKASHLRWPPEVQKKKKNIAMFWRRTPPETVLASVDLTRNVSPDPSPPPRSMTPTPQPPPERIAMAPEPIVSINLPPRSVTTPAAQLKPPPPSARRIAGLALRGSELDRIDELDESNPAGLPLHHNGPYEAAQKPATHDTVQHKVPHNIGSQYQIPAPQLKQDNKPDRKHEQNQQLHRRNLSDITSVPIVPAGISLNLSPGQVLPHNFYYQLDQNMIPPTAPRNAPGWPPQLQPQPLYQPQPQLQSRTHGQTQPPPHTQPYPTFHQNTYHANYDQQRPTEHSPVNPQMRLNGSSRPRNAPPDYSSLPTDHYVSKGDTKKVSLHVSPPLPNYKGEEKLAYDIPHIDQKRMVKEHQPYPPPVNIQPDFRINTPGPRHHQQSNPRLPPRMQALQMQIPRTDEKHRRSPRPPNAALEYAGPPSGNGAMQTGHRRRSHTPQMVDHNQPLFIDNNGFPASAPPPPSFDILRSIRDPIHPSAVSQPLQGYDQGPPPTRSIHNSSKSTNSGMSRGAPPPHHLPKHLVMPAPLQVSQPSAPQHRPQLSAGAHYLDTHSWQPQLRPPSPPIVPSALDPYIESQLRAEDMQMSQQSRKLRKRSSAQAIPLPPISQPLAFQTQKKLLSKRKTDFF